MSLPPYLLPWSEEPASACCWAQGTFEFRKRLQHSAAMETSACQDHFLAARVRKGEDMARQGSIGMRSTRSVTPPPARAPDWPVCTAGVQPTRACWSSTRVAVTRHCAACPPSWSLLFNAQGKAEGWQLSS